MMKTAAPLLQLSWSPPLVDARNHDAPTQHRFVEVWSALSLFFLDRDVWTSDTIEECFLTRFETNGVDEFWSDGATRWNSWTIESINKFECKNPIFKTAISVARKTTVWIGYIPKISPRSEFAPLWAEPSGTTLGAQNETSLPSRLNWSLGKVAVFLVIYIRCL